MGNPLGLTGTVTDGIVSATGRTVSEGQGSSAVLISAIQTSAAINPGNSGGALVNLAGQVIGIPTLAATDPQLGGAAAGIGFAIPSDTVTSIAAQLVAAGKVTSSGRASLGITAQTVADAAGQPAGVGIVGVTPGGAAARAGISAGDIITALAGQPTTSLAALQSVLAAHKPGDRVQAQLTRDGTDIHRDGNPRHPHQLARPAARSAGTCPTTAVKPAGQRFTLACLDHPSLYRRNDARPGRRLGTSAGAADQAVMLEPRRR